MYVQHGMFMWVAAPAGCEACRTFDSVCIAVYINQLSCVGLKNMIVLHILKEACVSGDQIIAYEPRTKLHFVSSFFFLKPFAHQLS